MLMIRMLWKGTLWHKYNNKKYWKHLMQLLSDLTNEKKGSDDNIITHSSE